MTANANKNKATAASLMSPVAGKVSEAVLLIMQMFGLQKIRCKKLRSAEFERIVAEPAFFEGTPAEIASCGMLIKDAVASILASTGIVQLEISSTKKELGLLMKGYKTLVTTYKNGGIVSANSPTVSEEDDVDKAASPSIALEDNLETVIDVGSKTTVEPEKKKACRGKSCCRVKK